MNYHVGDSIIRIKNAYLARRKTVSLFSSRMTKSVAETLVRAGFLRDVKVEEKDGHKVLTATLRYEKRDPVLTDVAIVSKPSLRVYKKAFVSSPEERKGIIVSVVSTNLGVMTGEEARKKGVGGEVLFRVW